MLQEFLRCFPVFCRSLISGPWNRAVLIELICLLHGTVKGTLHFFQGPEVRFFMTDEVQIIAMTLGIVLVPIKIYLIYIGVNQKNPAKLRRYSAINRCFVLPISVPIAFYLIYKPWIAEAKVPQNSVVGVTFVVIIFLVFIWWTYKVVPKDIEEMERSIQKFENLNREMKMSSPSETGITAFSKALWILEPNITLDTEKIGEGLFSNVVKARVHKMTVQYPVAAKTYKEGTATVSLLTQELHAYLVSGRHPNVLSLVGACCIDDIYYLLTPYCDSGNLKDYLKAQPTPQQNLSQSPLQLISLLLRFTYEICLGMEYLASRKVVHSDLASRNILLTKDLSVKVSDFGLSRKLENYKNYVKQTSNTLLPWRWMSPEALTDLKFSEKSDVWAYGITLWEIFTLGDTPYTTSAWDPTTINLIREGTLTLHQPVLCKSTMYNVMQMCWRVDPLERPTFSTLSAILPPIINSK